MLPALAPRALGQHINVEPQPQPVEHPEHEWEAKKKIIWKLYIKENRKLSYVMSFLSHKHSFHATYVISNNFVAK
jgi:hypothetical protein